MPEIPYHRWGTAYPTRCDSCGEKTRILYQIPDGTPDGEEDSVCEKCARGRMPKPPSWTAKHIVDKGGEG